MSIQSDYTAGVVTVSANGTTVTGTGTAWLTAQFQEGDWFIAAGYVGIVASVDSETSLTLVSAWKGGALSGAAYRLRYMSDGSRASAQARALINLLGGGSMQALAGLTGAANKLPYFTGDSTADLATLTAFARALLDDADAAAMLTTLGATSFGQGLLAATQARNFLARASLADSGNLTTIADDTVWQPDVASNGLYGAFCALIPSSAASVRAALFFSRANPLSPDVLSVYAGTAVNFMTSPGSLDGTTGTDGKINIRMTTSGVLQIENRSGNAISVSLLSFPAYG